MKTVESNVRSNSGTMRLWSVCGVARPLIPCLGSQSRIDALHRDALLDRADQRAQVAADALCFVHPRNALDGRHVGPVRRSCLRPLFTRDGRYGDRGARASFVLRGSRVQLDLSVHRACDTVEVNALMRAIPAGDMAKIAADALLLVNARNDLVIKIEVFPFRHAIERQPAKIIDGVEALGTHPALEALGHVFDNAITVVHNRGADLDRARAKQNELRGVAPRFDASDAGKR